MQLEMFAESRASVALAPGATVLRQFALAAAPALLGDIATMVQVSPFRQVHTPGGKVMSVAMFNCGAAGWVSDSAGYRYEAIDPRTGVAWPALPASFLRLCAGAAAATGYPNFVPDACLVNRYAHGTRMELHQDADERDREAPIVSVSLGLSATFLWGGTTRAHKARRIKLHHGDVVVWGGSSRMMFHGVDAIDTGTHPATGKLRYNLTFRLAR